MPCKKSILMHTGVGLLLQALRIRRSGEDSMLLFILGFLIGVLAGTLIGMLVIVVRRTTRTRRALASQLRTISTVEEPDRSVA
jgi:ABC-type nitrate/sulfonate/bicarbonate transport system permease component